MSQTEVDGRPKVKHDEKANQGQGRLADETHNPCIKESEMSLQCMNDSNFDRDKCVKYFVNYRNCMNFWKRVRNDRSWKGIKPFLPPPEDREEVKKSYYFSGK